MPADSDARQLALGALAQSAADNVPGADYVSLTVRKGHEPLCTLSATDPLAEQADSLQYEFREGPCYAAVTADRFVLVNDMAAAATEYPRYGPRAVALGIGAQAAIQLLHDGLTAGLNLYARNVGAFDHGSVQIAELFATQAGAILGFATQVEQLSEALHSRTDIGMAVGILMERYDIAKEQAFAVLVRHSRDRNIKLRILAPQVINGTFKSTPHEDSASQDWP